jgi:hypothetical protein
MGRRSANASSNHRDSNLPTRGLPHTFTPDFLKGIDRLRKAAGARCAGGFVLYNGQEQYTLKGTRLFNPIAHSGTADLAQYERKIAGVV